MKKGLLSLLFIYTVMVNAYAQEGMDCARERMKDYVIDGQPYKLVLKGADRGRIYFSFFDAFQYRIALCSATNKIYKIDLYDIQKKLLFSGTCEDYSKVLDMSFKSNIAGYIEIRCENMEKTDPVFQIVIGFKELTGRKISNEKNE